MTSGTNYFMGRNVDKRREANVLVVWNYSGEGQLFPGAHRMEGSGRSRRCSERVHRRVSLTLKA